MARSPRLALPGELHYLIQLGHNRQAVFVDDDDRNAYLGMLLDAAHRYGVAIHGYALLQSDVHLLATPPDSQALSRMMQSMGRRYVAAYNRRHARSGTLWAGRFRAGVIDGAAMGADALIHVESLPARMALVGPDADWPWSSAAHHLGRRRDPLISELPAYWTTGNTPFERQLAHADRLRTGPQRAFEEAIQAAAMQGRALGPPPFAARIGAQSGLIGQPRRRGRPAHPRGVV